jgi:hypothetical protein
MIDDRKQARIEEVRGLLTDFARQHFADAPDLAAYIGKLWDQIGRKRNYVIPGGAKKGTVSARAAEIEKACRIRMGHAGLCSEEISDGLTFVQLSNGIVLSKRMAKEMGMIPRPNKASEATSEPAPGADSSAPPT